MPPIEPAAPREVHYHYHYHYCCGGDHQHGAPNKPHPTNWGTGPGRPPDWAWDRFGRGGPGGPGEVATPMGVAMPGHMPDPVPVHMPREVPRVRVINATENASQVRTSVLRLYGQ